MAWVTPPTFTVGQVLTSSAMNTISGDLTALVTPLYDSGVLGTTTAAIDSGTLAIPSWASHLRVEVFGRSSAAATLDVPFLQFNGDTAANYTWGDTANSSISTTGTGAKLAAGILAASAGASYMNQMSVRLSNAFGGTWKSYRSAPGGGDITNLAMAQTAEGGTWRSTAAINRVRAFLNTGSWIAGSRMQVYAEA